MEHRHSHGQKHDGRPRGKGYRVAFLLAFAVALLAEMLLFMNAQMREVAVILKEDFRVIVVRDERARETPEAVEALLRAVPGTDRVFFVSRKDRLARLKAEEPELVSSVLTPGTNPMPDTWEVLVKEETLGDMGAWAALVWRVPGVADVKYKPLEAYAVMHALFYGHLTRLALAISFLALMIMAAAVLSRRPASSLASALPQARGWLLSGAGGAGAAVLAAYAAVYPVKYLSPVWVWPNPLWQAGVAACGAVLGWVLCEWKAEQQG